jgi:hypothetical protein
VIFAPSSRTFSAMALASMRVLTLCMCRAPEALRLPCSATFSHRARRSRAIGPRRRVKPSCGASCGRGDRTLGSGRPQCRSSSAGDPSPTGARARCRALRDRAQLLLNLRDAVLREERRARRAGARPGSRCGARCR